MSAADQKALYSNKSWVGVVRRAEERDFHSDEMLSQEQNYIENDRKKDHERREKIL